MKNFSLENYSEDKHDLVTRSGEKVKIGAIDASKGDAAIIGWVNRICYSWTIDGKYMDGETNGLDLFIKDKARKVYINITESLNGEITVYGKVDVKPRGPYKGAKLIDTIEYELK